MMHYKSFLSLAFLMAINLGLVVDGHAQLQGQAKADSLLQELRNEKSDTSKVKLLYHLSLTFASIDSSKALSYATNCMELSRQAKWPNGTGLAYLAFARIYYTITNYTSALQNALTAREIFEKLNDKRRLSYTIRTITVIYLGLGNYAQAIENGLVALRLFEERSDTLGIENMYTNIGVAFYYLTDYDKAIENYKKALPLCVQLDDKYGVASALDNIAISFMDAGKLDSANIYDLRGMQLFKVVNDQLALARIYDNRGDILSRLHDADSAFVYYNRAVEINKKSGIQDQLGSDYESIAALYFELAKDSSGKFIMPRELLRDKNSLLRKSQSYVAMAIPLIKNSGDINFLQTALLLASETEELLGNFRQALVFHKDFTLYKDSIFNDVNKKKIAALEMQRMTEVKDKEIQLAASEVKRETQLRNIILVIIGAVALLITFLIWSYNKRKKSAFDARIKDVEMKALRAQMNPHFIFNSLHSINKYVLENDKEAASTYLSKFASLMRLILENSREQEVSLEDDLHSLELYMQLEDLRFRNKFKYIIETDPAIDPENTLIPPMLLQPFVENAILHGLQNKENGLVKISVNKENDMIKCVIEDNGTGRVGTIVKEENKRAKSLGLQIITERLNIINYLKKAKAALSIVDLKDAENKPHGLRIELLLPFEPAY